jgi:hypothetical protein
MQLRSTGRAHTFIGETGIRVVSFMALRGCARRLDRCSEKTAGAGSNPASTGCCF